MGNETFSSVLKRLNGQYRSFDVERICARLQCAKSKFYAVSADGLPPPLEWIAPLAALMDLEAIEAGELADAALRANGYAELADAIGVFNRGGAPALKIANGRKGQTK